MEKLMSRKLISLTAAATFAGCTGMADVPNVAVDIAPVHSLVARVMQGVGAPKLIIQQGASPHEYNLRPSEAKALQDANLVFWMGERLTPWMENALESLANNAKIITLLEQEKTTLLDFRESALFEEHDPDEHGDEEPGEKEGHDEHGHEMHDPHAWLSLENANTWLNLIAAQLSGTDPKNAGIYFANAAEARAEIEALMAEVTAMLDPVRDRDFIVFHDAYQYFETTFDFPASGAISLGDASDPSPARIAAIQNRVREEGINCVLAEPQFNRRLIATVLERTDTNTGVIDPLGVRLEKGPALYPQLIRNMAKTLVGCL